MAICPSCGVEYEKSDRCPLCGSSDNLVKTTSQSSFPDQIVKTRDVMESNMGLRVSWWGAVSILSLAPLLLIMSIDIIFSKAITWSVFPGLILFSLWLLGTSAFLLKKRPLFLLLSTFFVFFFMLIMLDLIRSGLSWFFPVALPIIISLYLNLFWIFITSKYSKRIGFNLASFIIFGISVMCLTIDFVLHFYLQQKAGISWSIVIFAALVPIGGFFLYLHFILKKTLDLKRIFHL